MKVKIIRKEGVAVGWTIKANKKKEINIVNIIRDLQFFGLNETAIVYDGRVGGTEKSAGKLHWVQKQHKRFKNE